MSEQRTVNIPEEAVHQPRARSVPVLGVEGIDGLHERRDQDDEDHGQADAREHEPAEWVEQGLPLVVVHVGLEEYDDDAVPEVGHGELHHAQAVLARNQGGCDEIDFLKY